MKTTREWKQVTITKKGTKKLQSGHPWVYEGEVLALEANIQNGDIVDVFSEKGRYQGSGLNKITSAYKSAINFREGLEPKFFSHRVEFTVTLQNLDYPEARCRGQPKN